MLQDRGFPKRLVLFFFILTLSLSCGPNSQNSTNTAAPELKGNTLSSNQETKQLWKDVLIKQISSSSVIIYGEVMDISSRQVRNDSGDDIVYSDIELNGIENLKGNAGKRYSFKSLGGVIGEFLHSYSISPIFEKGEKVIIFIEEDSTDPTIPLGWTAAKLKVDKNNILNPSSVSFDEFKSWISEEIRQ